MALAPQEDPDLSIFFTNHVAGMMHRFWGDAIPGYSAQFGYKVDEVFGGIVVGAMDVFDHQLARILKRVDASSDTVLIIAASMGREYPGADLAMRWPSAPLLQCSPADTNGALCDQLSSADADPRFGEGRFSGVVDLLYGRTKDRFDLSASR